MYIFFYNVSLSNDYSACLYIILHKPPLVNAITGGSQLFSRTQAGCNRLGRLRVSQLKFLVQVPALTRHICNASYLVILSFSFHFPKRNT